MGIPLANIHSLSEFQRNVRVHLRRLKASGQPAVLTVNGHAEVVIQSAKAYQELLDDQDLLGTIRAISRGLQQARQGEGRSIREFLQEFAKEHRVSLK